MERIGEGEDVIGVGCLEGSRMGIFVGSGVGGFVGNFVGEVVVSFAVMV